MIGRWNGVDAHVEKYESINPYAYGFNNPIRFIDLLGKDPGDVVVVFAGADLSSDRGIGSTGDIVTSLRDQYFNERGGAIRNFHSDYWDTKIYPGYYGTSVGISNTMSEGNLNKATQEAYDYIRKKYTEGGRVIVYGYSYGGVLALHLEKRLAEEDINVNLVVTVDAAAGPNSDQVGRIVSDNTEENVNFYQDTPSSIGSRGGENKRLDGSERGITNKLRVTYVDEDGKKQNMTHSVIDEQTTEEVIQAIFNKLNE
jgi:hypothetical protein